MKPRFSILLPVTRLPTYLPQAIESIIAQSDPEFELFVICDGAPRETVECAQSFARRDPRVKARDFLKGPRIGEAYWHAVLGEASGTFVAYIEDDDLWFPNHLAVLGEMLRSVDFGHTIHVVIHPDGRAEGLLSDLTIPDYRQRFLDRIFNSFGITVVGHTMDAYRRLPEGWAPTPVGMHPDLHMWRKFFSEGGFRFATQMEITAVTLPSHIRPGLTGEDMTRESRAWLARVGQEPERRKITEEVWRSVVDKGIRSDLEAVKLRADLRTSQSALARLDAMYPGSVEGVRDAAVAHSNAQQEVDRYAELYHLAQVSLTHMNAKSEADLARRDREIVELRAEIEEFRRARSWRPFRAVRTVAQLLHRISPPA